MSEHDQPPPWLQPARLVRDAVPALQALGEETSTERLAQRLALPVGAVRAAVRQLEADGIVRYREDMRGWEVVR